MALNFLYMDEASMIEAGVLDMAACLAEMEEVFRLLSVGDYVMGGKHHNSHGIKLTFPDEPVHEGMSQNAVDRRFMAMPAYLGGQYQVAGCKWYGSNMDNKDLGLPRSILMMILNHAVTGAPLAIQSANLLSAMRTGAIPGIGARHLAPGAKHLSLIGAGAVATSSAKAILLSCPGIESIRIHNRSGCCKLLNELRQLRPDLTIEPVDNFRAAVREADLINFATAGSAKPELKETWIKPGTTLLLSSAAELDPQFVCKRTSIFVDNWKMYQEVAKESSYPYYHPTLATIGNCLLDWIHEGHLAETAIRDIGDVIQGRVPGRSRADEISLFIMGGQPVYDVAWSYRIYQNALAKGLGQELKLWDSPYLVGK